MITPTSASAPQAKLVSLRRLVDDVLSGYKKMKKDNRKFFINEVPRNLAVTSGKDVTDTYFANLFAVISSDHGATCVRISARRSDNVVKLFVKKTEIKGFSFSGIRVHAA